MSSLLLPDEPTELTKVNGDRARDPQESLRQRAPKTTGGAAVSGKFFAIDRRIWAKVCDCGMNEPVAYLILAAGTGPENRITSWSTTSVGKYGGIGIERAKAAIDRLIREKLIRKGDGHTRNKPCYELLLIPEKEADGTDERIWLPNSIVTGTESKETPPVQRLRSAGDVWALRLFVDLYHSHNLRDDGGISPQVIWQKFDRKQIAEQGIYNVWGFKAEETWRSSAGPFSAHQSRKRGKGQNEHPVWQSVRLLQAAGLIGFVPHLFENDTPQAEVVHPYGIGCNGEEPIEREIGEAADAAGREMAAFRAEHGEREGFEYFCPVARTLPEVKLVGVARLRYRPQTRRTGAWYAQLEESGKIWLEKYYQLARQAEVSRPEFSKFG